MKILKQSCPIGSDGMPDGKTCHANLTGTDVSIISILHIDQNHIILYSTDYDLQGHHSQDIHELAKAMFVNDTVKAQTYASQLKVSLNPIGSLST